MCRERIRHRLKQLVDKVIAYRRKLLIFFFIILFIIAVLLNQQHLIFFLEYNLSDDRVEMLERRNEVWDCDNTAEASQSYNLYSVGPVRSLIYSTPITYFEWGYQPGQLCNRIALLAAVLSRMKVDGLSNTLLALNQKYSSVIWELDFEVFSKAVAGVLMDCSECEYVHGLIERCGMGFNINRINRYVKCETIIVKGVVYKLSNRVLKIQNNIKSDDLWWSDRGKIKGYMEELTTFLQPKPYHKQLVSEMLKKYRKELGSDTNLVSIHRRFMDGYCYLWISDIRAHQCFPSQELDNNVTSLADILDPNPKRENLYKQEYYAAMSDEMRTRLEANPFIISCNYTLNDQQSDLLKKHFPILFSKPFGILLSSDRQDEKGEAALMKNKYSKMVKTLLDFEKPSCFSQHSFHYMLTDMLAMSMADIHIENSMSSCGDIVAHWRLGNGKPQGSSYPQLCYDGFYKKIKLKT